MIVFGIGIHTGNPYIKMNKPIVKIIDFHFLNIIFFSTGMLTTEEGIGKEFVMYYE